jgi:hypothetical protein
MAPPTVSASTSVISATDLAVSLSNIDGPVLNLVPPERRGETRALD